MEIRRNAQLPSDAIVRALADLDAAESCRFTGHRPPPKPSLKPLVLKVAPNAKVRRVGSWNGRQLVSATYECHIGDRRILWPKGCDAHRTPDAAWVCLARFITSPDFAAFAARSAPAAAATPAGAAA